LLLQNFITKCLHSANLLHRRSPFLCLEHVKHWERIASRWRPAFSSHLIKNPINRYLINSPMLTRMKESADGSLTTYIQKDSPGTGKESNWLPAPNGPIYVVMRLYWPKETPPSILPAGEGTWQPPAVMQVD
jgi:hypothetical protein